ncbi:MAG TPA: trehalose-phosphatase [Streptosporangiaceae bacterium]|nr:trehalose-phosphatase [Streptosporangiaceae bacterium]
MTDTRLADVLDDPPRTALCLDYDGTLTPIVADPAQARPEPGLLPVLASLARRLGYTAVISGRPVSFLREQLPVPGLRLLGLYGAEELVRDEVIVLPEIAGYQGVIAEVTGELRRHPAVAESGAHIEDKRFSAVLHLRRVADPQAWTDRLAQAARQVADAHGLAVVTGKMVWEIKPPVAVDKGSAVRRIATHLQAAAMIVVGDDEGDIPAFQAAGELSAAGKLRSLCVAVSSAEVPPRLVNLADLTIAGPEEVPGLLSQLSALLPPDA